MGLALIPETGLHFWPMESTIELLQRRLREAGARQWPLIAQRTGASQNTLRKIAYGDRTNPRLSTIEPLLRYFDDQRDAGAANGAV